MGRPTADDMNDANDSCQPNWDLPFRISKPLASRTELYALVLVLIEAANPISTDGPHRRSRRASFDQTRDATVRESACLSGE